MERQEKNNKEYYTIDVLHIVKSIWRRIWVVALCGFLAAALGFSMAAFLIAPSYSSYIKLYVNNSSFSLGNTSFSISSSELTAAQGLVKTYGEILDSRSALQRVIEKAAVKAGKEADKQEKEEREALEKSKTAKNEKVDKEEKND
jgi:capsular polysaccharide biosynthesis protein